MEKSIRSWAEAFGYEFDSELMRLECGTPEHGETIMLVSDGTVIHHQNGRSGGFTEWSFDEEGSFNIR